MDRLETFERYRSLLFAIAYRMLGTVTDAEDMLQEAWIRWQLTPTVVRSPQAFLSSLMTRLCIDRLRSARVRREQYVGTWLPEPLLTESIDNNENNPQLSESLSFAFLMLLECLSPTERAIFLLREVFDYDYSEIAKTVGKSIPNCRQIVRRARQHLVLRRPNISSSIPHQEEIVQQFLTSWNRGDVRQLIALMAEDITFWSDGGGRVTAARYPLHGSQKVTRFLMAIRRSPLMPRLNPQLVSINNYPGILNSVEENPQSTFSFEFSGRSIKSIFAVVNPEKLNAFKIYISE
jgi:RNA polymerase sigma-70 factor, ECF subfamily